MEIEAHTAAPKISSLWYSWYLLADLEGEVEQALRHGEILAAAGLGVDVLERRLYTISATLEKAIKQAREAGVDTSLACPELVPGRVMPWPLRGLHLWWSSREALAEAEEVTQRLQSLVAAAIKRRVGDDRLGASWFAEEDGSGTSRRRRGRSVSRRASGATVNVA